MKNTDVTYLKKGQSKKDQEIKKYRRRSKGLIILLIIVGIIALSQIFQNMVSNVGTSPQSTIAKGYLNQTYNGTNITAPPPQATSGLTSDIIKVIEKFMDKIFAYPGGFWVKFFIFLGIIYIIQIVFSLAFDVIELILLFFVAIRRSTVWLYRKITGRKNDIDKKIEEVAKLPTR